ncbi:unnamed protein product [Didymodactylos carnosus]|uniref:Innexin n=1 Tax=Didymodactylos carnosus TaxID=1234261 RepID=A0A813V017_9BILA|nr:unnamed protein product [Didymodactylos carnosus]CAF1379878.1 unnamed protein product [Didymodactylos carnosus]CAF3616771.1 unnamed protein product [Didymodactylos carnosus]CAF4188354.1 unnamed protein product [Didymodactylos carnosus]
MDLLDVAKKFNAGKHHSTRNDDVFIDRLNHRYTVTAIIFFAAVVTTQQYFGSPINCWVPAQFTGSYEKYANDICWIMNTYYVPMNDDIPHVETRRYERMLKYYQWSPFILMFMAFCFYFPRMLWRSLNNKSGLDIEKLVDAAMKQEQADQHEKKQDTIKYIVGSIQHYVKHRYNYRSPSAQYSSVKSRQSENMGKKLGRIIFFWTSRRLSCYLVLLFTFVKILYLTNSIIQIFLLNAFLGNDYHLFGIEVLKKFVRGQDWGESKRFPRVTLCDFHIREIGIVHRYTVQCVLPINLFNEKIFLILWFWILLLAAFNIGDLLAWLGRLIRADNRTHYVRRKLAMNRSTDGDINTRTDNDKVLIREFVQEYLQEDGCFALRLLARNGQDLIVGDIVRELYTQFVVEKEKYSTNMDHLHTGQEESSFYTSRKVPPSQTTMEDGYDQQKEERKHIFSK